MTKEEFADFIKILNNIWSASFDESKTTTWYGILKDFKQKGLIMSAFALSREAEFSPSIKKIVDKYDELKRIAEAEKRQRLIDEQRLLTTEAERQYQCPICDNSGLYKYARTIDGAIFDSQMPGSYEHYCRCLCARGRDLNFWGKPQIEKGVLWYNKRTNRNEDIYVRDVNDIFTPEEIAIIAARKSADYNESALA